MFFTYYITIGTIICAGWNTERTEYAPLQSSGASTASKPGKINGVFCLTWLKTDLRKNKYIFKTQILRHFTQNTQQWHENILKRIRVSQGECISKSGIPELHDHSANLLALVQKKHAEQRRQHGKHLIVMESWLCLKAAKQVRGQFLQLWEKQQINKYDRASQTLHIKDFDFKAG